jgi:hypothetical protein
MNLVIAFAGGAHGADAIAAFVVTSLARLALFVLSFAKLRSSRFTETMHRLTARLLLLFALAGSLVPLATALTAAPSHACCVRKAAHHCHEPAIADSSQLVIRETGCCSHDCWRAVTTAQWAHPQPKLTAFFLHPIDAQLAVSQSCSPATASAEFQSSRAPPIH